MDDQPDENGNGIGNGNETGNVETVLAATGDDVDGHADEDEVMVEKE